MVQNDEPAHNEFDKDFAAHYEGYVLITCRKPQFSGDMEIKMSYGGSALLAQMLVEGAHHALAESVEDEIKEDMDE